MATPAPPAREPGAWRALWSGAAARTADDDAIVTELYRQYRTPLLSYVLRLTAGDRQQAEDVVQETMVRAWRQARQLDLTEPSLMPWLAIVARRIVIDQGRRRRIRPTETGDVMLENVPVADATEDLLRKVVVTQALQALSPAHREVLNETILRDRTVTEAAEVLGIPVGTVKSRVYYALRALRLVLAERGVGMSAEHTDVGAYALGLLEQQDRQVFEDHLAGCPSCAAELAELSGVADLLSGVEPAPAADEPRAGPEVAELLGRRAAAQRRRIRWQVAAAVAASIVLLAGGIAVGIATTSGPASTSPSGVAITGQVHSAVDPVTGVAGEVGLVAKAWGTQVAMDLSRVRGPLECELVAVSRSGQRRVIAGWLVPAAGYGVPGHPGHLLLEGGTSIMIKDLSRVIVEVVGGRTLVSIPV